MHIAESYDVCYGALAQNIESRVAVWTSYFETATVQDYLLRLGIATNGMESHSAYVSLITVYGFGGVAWAIALFLNFRRKARESRQSPDALIRVVSSGCLFGLIAWCIYAMTADAISAQSPRYILFFLIVLVDRACAVARLETDAAPIAQPAEPLPLALQPHPT